MIWVGFCFVIDCVKILDGGGLDTNEGCEGDDKEECLMRRTLVAQTDYIYTNSTKT